MTIIAPGDAGYEELLKALKAEGGTTVKSGGITYTAIRDNDHINFVPTTTSSLDTAYASRITQPRLDVPFASPAEPQETAKEKARSAPRSPKKGS